MTSQFLAAGSPYRAGLARPGEPDSSNSRERGARREPIISTELPAPITGAVPDLCRAPDVSRTRRLRGRVAGVALARTATETPKARPGPTT